MRASESDRAVACPHSLTAPHSESELGKEAREWGHMVHTWKETGRIIGTPSHRATFRKKLQTTGVERHAYWKAGGEHEVTFALKLDDLTLLVYDRLEEELDRDDWKKQFDARAWLTGTIDWLVWGDEHTVPWVDDLKTGKWPVDVHTSRQLLSYLLVPWVIQGCPLDWRGVVSITQWPKYPLHCVPHRTSRWVTGFDLLEHLEDLRWAVAHPEEATAIPPVLDTRGRIVKMSPCAFCPNRDAHAFTGWMNHWSHSRMITCWEGIKTMLREGRLEKA